MSGSIKVGEVAGIRIELNYSWLIVLVLLTGSLAAGRFPEVVPGLSAGMYLLTGLVASLLLFGSVVAHELGHALVAQRHGVPVRSISLFIFGGIASLERDPRTPGAEFKIAAMGPLVSAVLGALSWGAGLALVGLSPLAGDVFIYVGIANLLLAGFNLIPGFPLDGGRVLRAILWKISGSQRKATRWAAWSGRAFAYLLMVLGVWQLFGGNLLGGLWIGFIGWFLLRAANSAESHVVMETAFRGVRVGDIMRPASVVAPANISVHQLVETYLLPYGLHTVPVVQVEDLSGVISLNDVRKVPRAQWDEVSVGMAMTPLDRLQVADPREPVSEALPRMLANGTNQLLVVRDGRLVGVLSREAVVWALEARRALHTTPAAPDDVPPGQPALAAARDHTDHTDHTGRADDGATSRPAEPAAPGGRA